MEMIAEQQKQDIINQKTESKTTMKASEARDLALKHDNNTIVVRKTIDLMIEKLAMSGERYCEASFTEVHDKTTIIKSLRADGFKVGFDYAYDPRDGTCSYVYRISW